MWKLFIAWCRCYLHLWWYFTFKTFLTFMNIMAAMTFKSFKLQNCHRLPALSLSDIHDLHRLYDHHYTIDRHKYLNQSCLFLTNCETLITTIFTGSWRTVNSCNFIIDVCRFSLPWLSSVFFRPCPPLVISILWSSCHNLGTKASHSKTDSRSFGFCFCFSFFASVSIFLYLVH